ncbi:MAG: ABC transporter substrate-binding protein [Syntrophales bacterium]|jgi:branched-chain amino acid transport system substrate-binding protein|nr:ABC transporter substrate-binding protein [Syntrophales bacterium]MDY0045356.1 ABC transporter substrate-binding protein [Syntrophales bacterium]
MKKAIAVFGIFFLLISTGIVIFNGTAGAENTEKIRLGLIYALSGPVAPWGISNSRAVTLDAESVNRKGGFTVNGKKYEFEVIVYDHKYIPAEAVKAANRALFADKCKFLSVHGGSPALACVPMLKENNILTLNNAGGVEKLVTPDNPLMFIYNPSIEASTTAIFPYLKKAENIKSIVIVNPDDATGKSGMKASRAAAEMEGFKVLAELYFERGSKDLTPLLTKAVSLKPDLLDTSYTDPTTEALICKQARELGYKGALLLGWGPIPSQVKKIAGEHAEKAYLVLGGPIKPVTPAQKEVYENFVAKWGKEAWDNTVWPQYGLATSLAKGIETAESLDSFKIAEALESITWETPVGTLRFGGSKIWGAKRHTLYPITLYQIQNGEPVMIKTMDVREDLFD